MYRVLFVDDEPIMRLAFRKMMDWDTSGFTLTASLSNGEDALSYVAANPVDIVVTDLKMPVMDGLELIERLKKNGFDGGILVLSSYNDFELVRTALTRGASDYLLKQSIDGEKLLRQLTDIAQATGRRAHSDAAEHSAPESASAVLEYLVGGAQAPPPELGALFEKDAQATPCLLGLSRNGANAPPGSAGRALAVLEQVLADAGGFLAVAAGETILLLAGEMPAVRGRRLEDKLNQAHRSIQTYLNLRVDSLIAPPAASPKQARQLLRQCEQTSGVFFYSSRAPVRYLSDTVFVHLPDSFALSGAADKYVSLYYWKSPLDAANYWGELMETCATLPVYPKEAQAFFTSAARKIAFAVSTGQDVAGDMADAKDAGLFLAELCGRLSELLDAAYAQEFEGFKKYKKDIRDVLLFVHFHFAGRISLDDLACAVSLNRSYLCRLFKQEMGEPIFSYINTLRMRKAAELIAQGSVYMRGVAADVGFDDQFYFARLFRKVHGISPSEYAKERNG